MLVYQRVYPHFINISQDQQPVVKKNLSSMVIPWVMTMTLTWDDPPNPHQATWEVRPRPEDRVAEIMNSQF